MRDLKLALVQSNTVWESPEANFLNLAGLLKNTQDVDLIVLPEMFSTGFTMEPTENGESTSGPSMAFMKELAVEKQSYVMGSFVCLEGDYAYNRCAVISPRGLVTQYDKRHCFRMAGEHEVYKPGKESVSFELNGWNIRPLICYDLRFPVWSRNTKDADIDLYIYVANWPAVRVNAWDVLLTARAIENLAYVVGVNRVGFDGNEVEYNGHSNAYDFKGHAIQKENPEMEGVLEVELSKSDLIAYRDKFPAHLDADRFEIKV